MSTDSTHTAARRLYCSPRSMRLTRDLEYAAVYRAKTRKIVGPLIVYAKPNGLDHCRLGMGVSRKVGNAVTRNRIKRRLREAFRFGARDVPCGYDVVISVRPHDPLPLSSYQRLWAKAIQNLHRRWSADDGA